MKRWDIPKIYNLSVENTESNIIAIKSEQRASAGVYRWYCTCCGDSSDREYGTPDEAIIAGESQHVTCSNSPDFIGACGIIEAS